MDANIYLWIILGLIGLSFVWGEILDFLNLRSHGQPMPEELKGRFDEEKYEKSFVYHQTNYRFGLVQGILSLIVSLAVIGLGWLGDIDGWLRGMMPEGSFWLPLAFFGLMYIASDILTLPFQWYKIFVIEERFGFNKMTVATFIKDKLKGYVLAAIMGGLVLGILLWLVDVLGESFWIWFWGFITAFSLFMTVFYSSIILPLFNKLTPLEEGELRSAITEYANGVDFPLDNIFVIDGSKRSTKANAFFTGLGKRKRIVLYDTLIEKQSTEELVAVLAHEVGHYKKKHIVQSLIISTIQMGAILFILSRFVLSPDLSFALGGEEYAIHLNLIAFGLLFSPISMIIGIFLNQFSRKNEFEADSYAATTYQAAPLQEALIKLSEENLSNLTPHPLYVFMHYSHPPLIQRLRALGKYAVGSEQ